MGVFSRGRGFGSTFFFELPLYRPDKIEPIPLRSKPRPQSGAQSARGSSSEKVYVSASGPTSCAAQNHTTERPPGLPSIQYGHCTHHFGLYHSLWQSVSFRQLFDDGSGGRLGDSRPYGVYVASTTFQFSHPSADSGERSACQNVQLNTMQYILSQCLADLCRTTLRSTARS